MHSIAGALGGSEGGALGDGEPTGSGKGKGGGARGGGAEYASGNRGCEAAADPRDRRARHENQVVTNTATGRPTTRATRAIQEADEGAAGPATTTGGVPTEITGRYFNLDIWL